jgi:release factor glutamine methyltransferase
MEEVSAQYRLIQKIEALLVAGKIPDASLMSTQIVAATKADPEQAIAMANECLLGKPLAYLLGRQKFMGVELLTEPGALIPREETELLGVTAVRVLREQLDAEKAKELFVIDMCCGSGNLACGIASALPQVRLWASDLTADCVSIAQRNVLHLALTDRVSVVQGNLFGSLVNLGLEGKITAVVCNPPYISTKRLTESAAALLRHEPREAFDGGPYGISIYQRVIKEAVPFLRSDGWLLFEVGSGQFRQVKALFDRYGAYEEVASVNDLSGEARVVLARKKGSR